MTKISNYIFTIFSLIVLITIASCRKDFSTVASSGELQFSKDTVFLDTVFTNIGSATYNLKVYNRSSQDITIPSITLENGTNSNYRINVDGLPGKSFQNIDILAKDSLFIFIETTIDANTVTNPLYTDKILFDSGELEQHVDLVTLVKDAHFIFPGRDSFTKKIDSLTLDGQATTIKGRFLEDSELTFTKDKPYVIYGYAAVPENKQLIIEAGAQIHFHDNSGLIVDNNASLKVNGTLNEKVVFEGDRLEHTFSNVPGQWGTIWLRSGSKENEINHAQIKNGIIGILTDSIPDKNTSKLLLKNVEIYNHSNYGILGRETSIEGENVVIGNTGQTSLALTIGGSYEFTHSTFANFWNNSLRTLPTVLVNNFFVYQNSSGQEIIEIRPLQKANFTNCIFDGNNNIELIFDKAGDGTFNFNVNNALVKFNDINNTFDGIPEMDFNNPDFYEGILLNGVSHFRNELLNDFVIGEESDAIGLGSSTGASRVPLDILGTSRLQAPDLGAYQHIDF